MRKILFALIGCFAVFCAHAAQVVNVDYVHKLIAQKWDISVPIKTNNIMAVANMKYLLTAVDVANEILNGEKTTDYGNGEFATLQVADTVATNQAVETLVWKEIEYKFFLTTTSTNSFSFSISAAGKFYVDWGDGKRQTITKPDATNTTYSHTYSTSKSYTIKLTGQATAYNTSTSTATISFYVNSSQTKIASIDGSLGAIFGTLSSDTNNQPRFYQTFYNAINMTGSIPSDLFAGISGAPASYMFYSTFQGCSGLTGAIPDGLFGNLTGAPASSMFAYTFFGCSGLTGAIPDGLFAGISGAPASFMFQGTFSGCSGLTSIPAGLFAGISGAPASRMFSGTFGRCSGLTSIPSDLFAGISGAPADYMFQSTFYGCSGLTGAIPDGLFAGISGAPASFMFNSTFYGCSDLTGAIPDGLFGNLTGAPASNMFYQTFYGCTGLTSIPGNLFGNISGTAQYRMFSETFYNCTSLTGPSARINGQYLYEIWPDATGYPVDDMYYNATGLDDYRCIPTTWGGAGENCSATPDEFTLTTTPDTNSFSFNISAAGEFVVDWGDGTVETITKPDTTDTTYSHNYDTANTYTIGIGGQATGYHDNDPEIDIYAAAISFSSSASKITSIDGSLGAIFGTLSSDTNNQPLFVRTFYNASNMTGSIPSDLFAGISGAPAHRMFDRTFYGCSGLTSIPEGLFAGISGAPADSMFSSTFGGCSGLTSIPAGLFA
ncbi:MAG: hypothetical protein IKL14_02100, partial [Alphaproteobacteria bacterium]|nr:hypothetical protein [Alphaproteobacteria bacterium]